MGWGKSKTKIPLEIKQTHSPALSPNLTFKTDHFSANSFLVSLKMNPPSPGHVSLRNGEICPPSFPQSGQEETAALFSTLPQ